jgi:hypothetical protein
MVLVKGDCDSGLTDGILSSKSTFLYLTFNRGKRGVPPRITLVSSLSFSVYAPIALQFYGDPFSTHQSQSRTHQRDGPIRAIDIG